MAATKKTLRICDRGHRYYKSTDCPTCPQCEIDARPEAGFLSLLASPARRALEHAGIATLRELSGCTEKEILALHGMGPKSMPILRQALASEGLTFRP